MMCKKFTTSIYGYRSSNCYFCIDRYPSGNLCITVRSDDYSHYMTITVDIFTKLPDGVVCVHDTTFDGIQVLDFLTRNGYACKNGYPSSDHTTVLTLQPKFYEYAIQGNMSEEEEDE